MGLAYKDRRQQVAIIGIEERIERVGMGRLRYDDIVPKVSVQQTRCKELDRIGIDGHDNLPLDGNGFRILSILHKPLSLRPVLSGESIAYQQ